MTATPETVERIVPQSHRTPSVLSRKLDVALNRALERRLGKVPSQTEVRKAAEALGGSKGLEFVKHAVRVQEQLARLHAQLQREQERHGHATEAFQDSSMSTVLPQKRSVRHDDDKSSDPPREAKRIRVESIDPRWRTPSPTSENGVKPDIQTPIASMSPKDVPIAPQSMRSDHKLAQISHAEPAKTPPAVDNSPSRTRITDDSSSNPGQDISRPSIRIVTHDQNKLDKAPTPPISTLIPEAKGSSPLTSAVTSNSTMEFPAFTRQQIPSSAPPNSSDSQDPEIWAIQVGKPSAGQTDVEFVVDQETANSVRRWAAHKQKFDLNSRHIAVHLVALHTTAVSAAQQTLSQSSQGITPQAFAQVLRDLPPQWPDDDSLVLQVNAGQPGEKTWCTSDMSGGTPLDISGAVCEGTNSLRILQLRNMADIVFTIYAARPTHELLAAAREWERGRKWFSFRRPHSGRLPA